MFLDWSGSMSGNLKGTLNQLFNLIWFCKKVNIPFDVYETSLMRIIEMGISVIVVGLQTTSSLAS